MSDYRNIDGERGKFQEHHNVWQKTGRGTSSKPGCKGTIIRKTCWRQGARTSVTRIRNHPKRDAHNYWSRSLYKNTPAATETLSDSFFAHERNLRDHVRKFLKFWRDPVNFCTEDDKGLLLGFTFL